MGKLKQFLLLSNLIECRTDHHDINGILLNMALLNTITLTLDSTHIVIITVIEKNYPDIQSFK